MEQNQYEVQQAVNNAMQQEKKKKRKKKTIIIVVLLIAFFGIIAAASSGDDETTKVEDVSTVQIAQNTSETAAPETTQAENNVIKAGKSITTKNLKISYISCDANYTKYSEFSTPSNNNKVIRAEFEFENISSSDVMLENFECYADGKKCETFWGTDDYADPVLESISAGRSFTGIVYYEVPKNAQKIELEMESSFWSSDKIVFIVE